jgi:hypothetical protein
MFETITIATPRAEIKHFAMERSRDRGRERKTAATSLVSSVAEAAWPLCAAVDIVRLGCLGLPDLINFDGCHTHPYARVQTTAEMADLNRLD